MENHDPQAFHPGVMILQQSAVQPGRPKKEIRQRAKGAACRPSRSHVARATCRDARMESTRPTILMLPPLPSPQPNPPGPLAMRNWAQLMGVPGQWLGHFVRQALNRFKCPWNTPGEHSSRAVPHTGKGSSYMDPAIPRQAATDNPGIEHSCSEDPARPPAL